MSTGKLVATVQLLRTETKWQIIKVAGVVRRRTDKCSAWLVTGRPPPSSAVCMVPR